MRRFFCLLLLFVCGCANHHDLLKTDLQNIVDRFHSENQMAPGISVYAECPALNLKWEGLSGTVAKNSDAPLKSSHTFRIASNTKTYVAAAMLRLVEDGVLTLDDTLAQLLNSEWKAVLSGDGYALDKMTLKQVLSHTSGLGDHSAGDRYGNAIMAEPLYHWTADEQVKLCAKWADPVGAPGELYKYSDTGYIILGSIIQEKTGKNLGQAVRHILDYDSLGLHSTWWQYMEEKPEAAGPRAHQYFGDQDVTEWNASCDLYGGGGLLTDTVDLARFMRLLLTEKVLKKEATLLEMTRAGTEPYRLGLMHMQLGGHDALGHQGFWNTFAFHIPSLDLTLSGVILNHHAANGRILADRLAACVSEYVKNR